jgi:hypothetical protein
LTVFIWGNSRKKRSPVVGSPAPYTETVSNRYWMGPTGLTPVNVIRRR